MKKITTYQLRLLSWSRKKSVHGAICWSVLFLLSIGFNTILLLDEYWGMTENGHEPDISFLDFIHKGQPVWLPAFGVILKDSVLLTFSLLIMVSFNLSVLKRGILDRKIFPWWRDGLYLLVVILSSAAFTWLLEMIEKKYDLIRVSMRYPLKCLIYFAFALISTGFVYLRELYDKRRDLLKALFKQHGLKEEMDELFGEMEDLQKEVGQLQEKLQEIRIAQNHVKIGTKDDWQMIRFKKILYIQGQGNGTKIFVRNNVSFDSTMRMVDFEEELPASMLIRVHKSFIISKFKVLRRRNGYFILKDCNKPIPIGDTYGDLVDSDPYLGFLRRRGGYHMKIEQRLVKFSLSFISIGYFCVSDRTNSKV